MTRYQILDAARMFLRAIKDAPPEEFNAAYQRLANEVNDSERSEILEPKSGLVVAMQAQARCVALAEAEALAAEEA